MNMVQYKSVSLLKNTMIYFFSYFFNLIAQLSVCLGSDDAVLQCLFSHPWERILDPMCAIGAAKVTGGGGGELGEPENLARTLSQQGVRLSGEGQLNKFPTVIT